MTDDGFRAHRKTAKGPGLIRGVKAVSPGVNGAPAYQHGGVAVLGGRQPASFFLIISGICAKRLPYARACDKMPLYALKGGGRHTGGY